MTQERRGRARGHFRRSMGSVHHAREQYHNLFSSRRLAHITLLDLVFFFQFLPAFPIKLRSALKPLSPIEWIEASSGPIVFEPASHSARQHSRASLHQCFLAHLGALLDGQI